MKPDAAPSACARWGRLLARAAGLALGIAVLPVSAALLCQLDAPRLAKAGAPLMLHFSIRNSGPSALRLLDWGTPFEPGWFAPFVEVMRDGQALPYQGPSLKRGEPEASDYVAIPAHRQRHARVDLALAFDLSAPGHYRVLPRLQLHDVLSAGQGRSRPRQAHQPQPLACNAVEFELR